MRRSFYYLAILGMAAGCRAPQLFSPPQSGQPLQPAPSAFQDVGTLGLWTQARGLNDAGDVVGSSSATQYGDYPILSQNGAARQLEMFANVADGAMSGRAGAIDAVGTIAGVTGTNGLWYVTLWDSTGKRTNQTLIGNGRATWADVVSEQSGAVLAWWQLAPDRTQGIVVKNGAVRSLGQLSAIAWTEPSGLNRNGQAVGRSAWTYIAAPDTLPDSPTDTVSDWIVHHPFRWDGAIHDLGVFGRTTGCTRAVRCANGAALAIDDAGDVVGWSEDSALVARPFLWRAGTMRDLGAFPGKPAYARAINASGVIAGDGGKGEAFTWSNGTIRNLGSLGGGYTEVTAMNDAGDVAGTALTPSGEQHAFVYTGGRMIDLGLGLPGACAARATAINSRGDVLIAVMRQCFKRLEDPRLTDFSFVRPQLAAVWRRPNAQ